MPHPTPAMLTFLSPAWALGLVAAVGLPVLAHLLSRTRYLPVVFPGTRFVVQAVLQTQQVNRPRHWLLLLLRILALAAVVGAFMQPRWDRAAAASPGQRGELLVLIVDSSASIRRHERGEPLFDKARKLAHDQLDALDPRRDRAVVILAGRSPRPLLREPSGNFTLLHDRLDAASCTYESADLAAAVALADTLIAEQPRAARILLISDGQASNRPGFALTAKQSGAPIGELRVGDGSTANVSLHLTDATPYPPVAGVPMELTVELRNFGDGSAEVVLHAEGGKAPTSRRLTLAPGAAATQRVTAVPAPADAGGGPVVFRVWLDANDDGFTLDNETGLVVPIAPARRVWVFTDAPAGSDSAASRIALALAPPARDDANAERASGGRAETDRAAGEGVMPLRVVMRAPDVSALAAPGFDDPSACWVIAGVGLTPPAAFLDALEAHLDAGGGVVWVADTAWSRSVLSAMETSPLRPEGAVDGTVTGRDGNRLAVVASARFEHAVFDAFEGPSRASLVGARLAGVSEARAAEDAAVLLRAADGRPVLAVRHVGRGRLVVFNADLTPGRSDFAASPGFVALFSELARFAAPGPAMPTPPRPGDTLPDTLAAAGGSLQRPADDIGRDADNTNADPNRITAPGPYLALADDGSPRAGLWAELDPAESDFTPAALRNASDETAAGDGPVMLAAGAAGAAPPRVVELWPYLVLAALLLAGAESLLLLAFARGEGRA